MSTMYNKCLWGTAGRQRSKQLPSYYLGPCTPQQQKTTCTFLNGVSLIPTEHTWEARIRTESYQLEGNSIDLYRVRCYKDPPGGSFLHSTTTEQFNNSGQRKPVVIDFGCSSWGNHGVKWFLRSPTKYTAESRSATFQTLLILSHRLRNKFTQCSG